MHEIVDDDIFMLSLCGAPCVVPCRAEHVCNLWTVPSTQASTSPAAAATRFRMTLFGLVTFYVVVFVYVGVRHRSHPLGAARFVQYVNACGYCIGTHFDYLVKTVFDRGGSTSLEPVQTLRLCFLCKWSLNPTNSSESTKYIMKRRKRIAENIPIYANYFGLSQTCWSVSNPSIPTSQRTTKRLFIVTRRSSAGNAFKIPPHIDAPQPHHKPPPFDCIILVPLIFVRAPRGRECVSFVFCGRNETNEKVRCYWIFFFRVFRACMRNCSFAFCTMRSRSQSASSKCL